MFLYFPNLEKAKIDNFPSRLHYKFTSGFLFMSTALLGLNDMFGKVRITNDSVEGDDDDVSVQDIQCHHQDDLADKAVTQYCWISGTFTVPGRLVNNKQKYTTAVLYEITLGQICRKRDQEYSCGSSENDKILSFSENPQGCPSFDQSEAKSKIHTHRSWHHDHVCALCSQGKTHMLAFYVLMAKSQPLSQN